MNIVNESNMDASWWCYNSNDASHIIELKYGMIKSGGSASYDPPSNGTGRYYVRFNKEPGGGTSKGRLGSGELPASGTIVLKGSDYPYTVEVS